MPSKTQPLVVQEMASFIRHSLHDATRGRAIKVSLGDAGTGSDVDDIAFSPVTRRVFLEMTGDGETETGRVVAYSRFGHEIAVDAVRHGEDRHDRGPRPEG